MAVKKIKIDKLHVVSDEVPHRTLRRFIMSFALVLVAVIAFIAGMLKGENDQIVAEQERDILKKEIKVLQADYKALSETKTSLVKGEEITNQAQEMCRIDVKECRQEVAELKYTVTTYKNLMNPDNKAKGLKIHKWDVKRTANQNIFEYNLVIAQVSDNTRYISGNTTVNVIGYSGSEKQVHEINNLAATKQSFKFRMKYLKEWRGEFTLPEGFVPDKFEIVVKGTNKNKQVKGSYPWDIEVLATTSPATPSTAQTGTSINTGEGE